MSSSSATPPLRCPAPMPASAGCWRGSWSIPTPSSRAISSAAGRLRTPRSPRASGNAAPEPAGKPSRTGEHPRKQCMIGPWGASQSRIRGAGNDPRKLLEEPLTESNSRNGAGTDDMADPLNFQKGSGSIQVAAPRPYPWEERARMSADASDLSLVRRVQRGDKGAFDALVLKYQHKLVKLVMRYVRNPAEAE